MDSVQKATGGGAEHSEGQKRQIYDSLSDEQKEKQSYKEWVQEAYNTQYEKWMPWIEDQYLKWFGKGDNKASYATKDTLNQSKVTGVSQVDQLQDDAHNLVGNQVGQNGIMAPVGNWASKEGVNRAERGGKDEKGSFGGPASNVADPMVNNAKGAGESVSGAAQSAGGSLVGGAKSAGSYVGLSGDK